jgi:hypothetical protein
MRQRTAIKSLLRSVLHCSCGSYEQLTFCVSLRLLLPAPALGPAGSSSSGCTSS